MKYVALVVVGVTTGFLISRFLVPFLLNRGGLGLLVPAILLAAALLIVRMLRRTRSGS